MAGLNLIQEYSSDTDEETELSNEENKTFFNVANSSKKLPLPESILSLKGTDCYEKITDNPVEHQGRIRSFKHERGNWASLVYINYIPNDEILQWIKNAVEQTVITGNLFQEFHVSLTRTLILKFHWIDSFVEALKKICNGYPSFVMELNSIEVYCNEDKTRTFMGITVQSTDDSLFNLTHALDKLLDEYQLPSFYKDASYHVSFFWCLGDQRQNLKALLPKLTSSFYSFLINHQECQYIKINSLEGKIGNKLYSFKLS